jgi:hypothetical protein
MDFIVTRAGVMVHAQQEWPCGVCRPQDTIESGGAFLCLECAHHLIERAAKEATKELDDDRSGVSEVADAVALLECKAPAACAVN